MTADVHQLAKMLHELDDQMVACMKCGLCQAVCPVFAETMNEGDVARGKIALLENLSHEMIKDPEGVQDKLNMCLLCGSCAANCPSGVKVLDIFLKARVIVNTYMGLPTVKKVIFQGLLTKPALFNSVLDVASKFQGVFTKTANDVIGSSCSRIVNAPVIGERHFMPLAPKPLRKLEPTRNTRPGKSGYRVAFFPGCVIDKIYPRVGQAVLKALTHHEVGIYMPSGQACCGIPALASGDKESFDKLVKRNLEVFEKENFDYLLTACATCTATMHELWPLMSGDKTQSMQDRIAAMSAKVMDVNQFMVDVLKVAMPVEGHGAKITYHDPCHLKKSMKVSEQPRQLLKTNPNVEFVEMADADRCCGCGGSFNLQHYKVSKDIGTQKRDNIVASGAQIVATGCPACMMQISDMLSQNKDNVAVKHVMEIYAETL
ncbi:glycolate oxidase iron-sulfur subunit [Desulfomicrobium apsheronum]|uniref:Glycolate oxidase iron-sulfur subunit n=1 Tax=Desulfomicrobium apsheronum TaxID=52560 RepID=A0A1I3WGD3_9BACT|nr:(Fe-S)-binding protein [Desulfomicrobium apsheronum]SFK06223.1 glycolate oxidase iron-sulfur subunit [Desulfomicrobium apsheronum]